MQIKVLLFACLVTTVFADPIADPIDLPGFVTDLEITPEEVSRALLEAELLRNGRIMLGSQATTNQFPHFGYAVLYRSASSTFCGSTLIATQWVISAAHCMNDVRSAQIFFGGNDKQYMKVSQSINGYAIHEEYQWPSPLMNDIAILHLTAAVAVTTAVKPIQLPARSEALNSFSGVIMVAAGFGKTTAGYPRYLHFTSIQGLSDQQCLSVHWVFKPTMLCGRGANLSGSSVCFGDSGGPLIRYDNAGVPTFVGVNSYVQTNECINDVQGFTRVDKYLDWINKWTGIYIRY